MGASGHHFQRLPKAESLVQPDLTAVFTRVPMQLSVYVNMRQRRRQYACTGMAENLKMNEGEDQHLTVKLRRQRRVSPQMLSRLWPLRQSIRSTTLHS